MIEVVGAPWSRHDALRNEVALARPHCQTCAYWLPGPSSNDFTFAVTFKQIYFRGDFVVSKLAHVVEVGKTKAWPFLL